MKQIVIAVSGWAFVGDFEPAEGATVLRGASVVRVWGTTKGIGEIALGGPTKDTVLDPCGVVRIPAASVVATIECNEASWTRKGGK